MEDEDGIDPLLQSYQSQASGGGCIAISFGLIIGIGIYAAKPVNVGNWYFWLFLIPIAVTLALMVLFNWNRKKTLAHLRKASELLRTVLPRELQVTLRWEKIHHPARKGVDLDNHFYATLHPLNGDPASLPIADIPLLSNSLGFTTTTPAGETVEYHVYDGTITFRSDRISKGTIWTEPGRVYAQAGQRGPVVIITEKGILLSAETCIGSPGTAEV